MNNTPGQGSYRNWKGWDQKTFGARRRVTDAYYAAETSRCGFADMNAVSVLEIGFGNGEFARWAIDHGATYVGTEVIPELLSCARDAGLNVLDAANSAPLTNFIEPVDLVVALDVFEHFDLDALRDLLVQIRGCLRNEGCLLIRVPSGDSPFALAIQNGDLTHRMCIGSSALRQLADQVGLTLLSVREPSFLFRGIGARAFMRRVAITALRRVVFPVITHGFMGGGNPVLTPNLVAIFRND